MSFRRLRGLENKIIIADDHPLFREGLARLVRQITLGTIIEVADFDALQFEVHRLPVPSLMILDLVFPGFKGAESVFNLRQSFPQTAIIVISMTDGPDAATRVIEAGANGFISKSVPPEQIAKAVNDVLGGELVMLLEAQPLISNKQPSDIQGLTLRQAEILRRLGQGKSNKEIARDLGISPFTVRAHMSALFKKLNVSSRTAAAAIAAQIGLV